MTVQMAENWSEVRGTIVSSRRSAAFEGFIEMRISIEAVNSVEGYVNMLDHFKGSVLTVLVPLEVAKAKKIAKDKTITCWIRLTPAHKAFIHPEMILVSD